MLPHLENVAKRVEERVLAFCKDQGFAYSGRTKSAESVAEKLETGRYKKWSDLDDLFGCSIVIPTRADEQPVLSFLGEVFIEVELRKRGSTKKSPETFRFETTRFIGRLRLPDDTDENAPLRQILFEIQIRTAFEHAWSATTHALVYKAKTIDWKTYRLAAQLKAAVEQLDSLVMAFEQSADTIVEHEWPETAAKKLILDSFARYVQAGQLPAEMVPKDWSRFAENLFGLIRAAKGRKYAIETDTRTAMAHLDKKIGGMISTDFPLSISLFQFAFAVLSEAGFVKPPIKNFCPLVTRELLTFYPQINGFSHRVSLGS